MANSQNDNEVALAFFKVGQLHRTIRTVVWLGFIGFSLWSVLDFFKRSWEEVLIAFLIQLLAPSGLIYSLYRLHCGYVKRNHERIRKLEQEKDPTRTSSGLRSDGTDDDV